MDEAAVARGALEQEGIETFLANEYMVTLVWTLSQATGGVRLSVASKDAERARKILGSAADANAAIQDDGGGRIAADEDEPIPAADELVEAGLEVQPARLPRLSAALPSLGPLAASPRLVGRRTAHRARPHPGEPGAAGERLRGNGVHRPLRSRLLALTESRRTRLETIDDDAQAIHRPAPRPSGAGRTAGGDLVVAERVPRESRRPCRARALLGRRSHLRQRCWRGAQQGRDPQVDARGGHTGGARHEARRAEDRLLWRRGEGPSPRRRRRRAELPPRPACRRQDELLPQQRDIREARRPGAGGQLAGNAGRAGQEMIRCSNAPPPLTAAPRECKAWRAGAGASMTRPEKR